MILSYEIATFCKVYSNITFLYACNAGISTLRMVEKNELQGSRWVGASARGYNKFFSNIEIKGVRKYDWVTVPDCKMFG